MLFRVSLLRPGIARTSTPPISILQESRLLHLERASCVWVGIARASITMLLTSRCSELRLGQLTSLPFFCIGPIQNAHLGIEAPHVGSTSQFRVQGGDLRLAGCHNRNGKAQSSTPIGGVTKSDAVWIGIAVAAIGAGVGIGIYYAFHHGHSLTGCAVSGPMASSSRTGATSKPTLSPEKSRNPAGRSRPRFGQKSKEEQRRRSAVHGGQSHQRLRRLQG